MTTAKISDISTEVTDAPASADLIEVERDSDGVSYQQQASNWFKWLLTVARTFTAAPVIETGAAGASPAIFRQTGGTPGTDDLELSEDGSKGIIRSKNGVVLVDCDGVSGSSITLTARDVSFVVRDGFGATTLNSTFNHDGIHCINSTSYFGISSGVASAGADTFLQRTAAGQWRMRGTSNAGAWLEFEDISDIGTPSTNHSGIGSESGELVGVDSAGNETVLTPHADDGPAVLYDFQPGLEKVCRTINASDTGREVRYLNNVRAARVGEKNAELLAMIGAWIKTQPAVPVPLVAAIDNLRTAVGNNKHISYREESAASYNARNPSTPITVRTWAEREAIRQARWDEACTQEQAVKDAYDALPAKEREGKPVPVVRGAYVPKPKPSWMA